MASEVRSWTRQGEAFWLAHHEAWKRRINESTAVLRGRRHPAQGFWQLAGEVQRQVEMNRETGRPRLVRAVAAVDSGQVVNPDGLTNQIEGAIMQSMSWTLYEAVTFDDTQDHQHRLADLSDPALRCRSRQHRGAHHQSSRPTLPRQRRDRTGTSGGFDRQRHCRRHRKTVASPAVVAKAHKGCDRCVKAAIRSCRGLDELHLVTGSVEDAEHPVNAVARIARICAEIHIMGG
jgi:hypothetical protein